MSAGRITLSVNDIAYVVDANEPGIAPTTTLLEFLRQRTPFSSAKHSCNEGACGACTVAWEHYDSVAKKTVTQPINACLALLNSLNGTKIYTNESLGNRRDGPSPMQKLLADNYGAQCGYCCSGFLMTMSTLLKERPKPTPQDVEKAFDGNLCRCTGYRRILDTFQEVAKTAREGCLADKCACTHRGERVDIEDAGRALRDGAPAAAPEKLFHVRRVGDKNVIWQDVTSLSELSYYVNEYANLDVMITVGATSLSFWSGHDVYLNVARIPQFVTIAQGADGLTAGAAVTVQQLSDFLATCTSALPFQTSQYPAAVELLNLVGGKQVRTRGSVVGNLVLCHQEPSFQSDVAIALMGLDATVTLVTAATNQSVTMPLPQFFSTDLKGKYVSSFFIPWGRPNTVLRTFKVAQRQMNDHAIVNMAVRVTLDPANRKIIVNAPILALGGVLRGPQRLTSIEAAMVGVDVTNLALLQKLCANITSLLTPSVDPTGGRVAFRLRVAVNLVYKCFLSLQPTLDGSLALAAKPRMVRGVSSGAMKYTTDAEELPVSLPVPKTDGVQLTTGEAQFVDDIEVPEGCTYGAMVLSERANADIVSVNPKVAEAFQGFVAYYDHTSLPSAQNSVLQYGRMFCGTHADFAGHCIGLVVAESEVIARMCAAAIQKTVVYGTPGTVVVTIDDAIAQKRLFPSDQLPPPVSRGDFDKAVAGCPIVVADTFYIGPQYHTHFESHIILVRPVEDAYYVDVCTQGAQYCQEAIAKIVGVPSSQVVVTSKRCGGAFGGKAIGSLQVSFLAAVAAKHLKRPFKLRMSMKEPQWNCGGRPMHRVDFTAGLTADNKICALKAIIHTSSGPLSEFGGAEARRIAETVDNCYNIPNFRAECKVYWTDTTTPQSLRGPGSNQASAFAEMMITRIATATKTDVNKLRSINFYVSGDVTPDTLPIPTCTIGPLTQQLLQNCDYAGRSAAISQFNTQNRFVKRGIAMGVMRFPAYWNPTNFNAVVAIFSDGSISVTHGGAEVGQGIHTKMAQVAAYKFGLKKEDLPVIRVFNNTTQVCSALNGISGGSVTSELCARCVMDACDTLLKRLQPLRRSGQSWTQLIVEATGAAVDLTASGYTNTPADDNFLGRYSSFAAAVGEVEVDALSGQFEVRRVDIMFDAGISMNPLIDIGQIQGGFMMGQGWFTQEVVAWDPVTGVPTQAGMWNYKIPAPADIPEVFNVSLLENSTNKLGVLNSKALTEPCVTIASCVPLALQNAINAQREEAGLDAWTCKKLPLPPDEICLACGVTPLQYKL